MSIATLESEPLRKPSVEVHQTKILMDGKWVVIPPRAVLQSLAPDGGSHICANRTGTIYCFMGGVVRANQ